MPDYIVAARHGLQWVGDCEIVKGVEREYYCFPAKELFGCHAMLVLEIELEFDSAAIAT